MIAATVAVGDVVRARTAAGVWRVTELHLVRGEAECQRIYGTTTRVFPTTDLTRVEETSTR